MSLFRTRMLILSFSLALLLHPAAAAADGENQVVVRGLELPVDDLAAAERLYLGALGFQVVQRPDEGQWSVLRNRGALLLLRQVSAPPEGKAEPYLNLRVADLGQAGRAAQSAGARVPDLTPRPNAIGTGLPISDASGNPMNLMRITGDAISSDSPPLTFNVGFRTQDMEASEAFLTALGLTVLSRDYLPQTLVWERHGRVSLVIHRSFDEPSRQPSRGVLLAAAPDPQEHLERLRQAGWQAQAQAPAAPLPESWLLKSPSGIRIRLMGPLNVEEDTTR